MMHESSRLEQDLRDSLSRDKPAIGMLIGAGCPLAVRVDGHPLIPDIRGLTSAIASELQSDPAFKKLEQQFTEDGQPSATIEDFLSRVRVLRRVAGSSEVRGLAGPQLEQLEKTLCGQIALRVGSDLPTTDQTAFHDLADWIGGTTRSRGIQIFTTNYDLLIEQALESRGVSYFDGFVGAHRPFFDTYAIEEDEIPQRWTRVWKLHGSINWEMSADKRVRRYNGRAEAQDALLIHPSELKYDQSRRMPYLVMMDRLRRFLSTPSAFFVTCGYSFSDDHLNEMILDGLRRNPTAAGFGLLYGELKNQAGALRVSEHSPPNLVFAAQDEGILRCKRGKWTPPQNAAPALGEFKFGDFGAFTSFLSSL